MRRLLLFVMVLITYNLNATLSPGAIAEDWTLDDINGNTHSLYADYLDQGWSVVIDMSATWCGPCWTFHQSGTMEDIYDDYGPGGEELIMPMMIEVDGGTNQACFYGSAGCNSSTLGNWSSGINYPLFNPISSVASDINNDYAITVFPTMYVISPSGYVQPFTGSNTSYEQIESWGAFSFQMENTTYTVDAEGCGDDSIDLHPVGGLGSISYQWSNGATTEDIDGLIGGDYFVTMTDDNGYEWEIGPIEVNGYPQMNITSSYVEDVDCYGNTTGFIEIASSGGSGSLNYEWSNGESGPAIYDLSEGGYDVTISDNNSSCEIYDSYQVYEPDVIEVVYDITNALCGETMGEVEFDNEGGTTPFEYEINGNTYYYDVIELPVGSYTANITDYNGCTETASFSIGAAPQPNATSSASGQITCSSSTTTLSASGSTTGNNISYTWYDSAGNNVGSGLSVAVGSAGNYTLNVTDTSNGCSASSSVTVASNTAVPSALAGASNNLTCNNPSSTLSGTGSATGPNITYLWSTADGNITSANNTMSITVNAAGTYSLLVTDTSNGCSSSTSLAVTQSGLPSISSNGNTSFCEGSTTNICVPLAANETIQWTENGTVVGTSSCYTASSSSTYVVFLTNSVSGCTVNQTVQTTAFGLPNSSISGINSFCEGSSTSLCYTAEDQTSYDWKVNGVSMGSATCITVNTAANVDLSATHNLTGCASNSVITTTINGLPTATIAAPGNIDCNNTSTVLDLSTNTANSTYAWYDQAGTLISNSEDVTVSQAGTYTAYVTNPSGCQAQSSVQVIADTSVPVISIDSPALIDCNNTSSTINLNVNNTNYTINWYDTAGNLVGSTEDITVSQAGEYTAVVTNPAGCETQASIVVSADTSLPSVSVAAPGTLDCNVSAIVLDANIMNGTSITWSDANGNVISNSEDVTVNTAGTYTISVSNAAGCNVTTTVNVAQINNAIAQAEFSFTNAEFDFTFADASIGSVTSYVWNFGDGNVSTDANPMHTFGAPGYYNVCLEASNECGTTSSCTEVLAVAAMTSSAQQANVTCSGSGDGSATVFADGGLPGYSYLWFDPMITGPTATGLAPGMYSVVITDQVGTQSTVDFTITEPDPITVTSSVVNTTSSATDGSITLDISGGTGDYRIVWSDGGDGTNLAQGTYTVVIADDNDCTFTETFTVVGTSSVNDIDGLTEFTVSPNPASDFVRVNAEFENKTLVKAYIVNTIGQRQYIGTQEANVLNFDVDVSSYAEGIYLIELRSNNQVAVKKLSLIK